MKLSRLMKQARIFSDWEIQNELEELVVPLADSEEDAEQLRQYGKQRRNAPNFRPNSGHNNHNEISDPVRPPDDRDSCPLSEQDAGRGACRAKCDHCGRSTYVRKDGTWARHTPPKKRGKR